MAAGGLVGASLRFAAISALPFTPDGVPWGTLLVNVSGSALLGLLMAVTVERAPQGHLAARLLRHLLGIGALGAFTTYSTFALETDLGLRAGSTVIAVASGAAAVGAGIGAAALGSAAGRRLPLRWPRAVRR